MNAEQQLLAIWRGWSRFVLLGLGEVDEGRSDSDYDLMMTISGCLSELESMKGKLASANADNSNIVARNRDLEKQHVVDRDFVLAWVRSFGQVYKECTGNDYASEISVKTVERIDGPSGQRGLLAQLCDDEYRRGYASGVKDGLARARAGE